MLGIIIIIVIYLGMNGWVRGGGLLHLSKLCGFICCPLLQSNITTKNSHDFVNKIHQVLSSSTALTAANKFQKAPRKPSKRGRWA